MALDLEKLYEASQFSLIKFSFSLSTCWEVNWVEEASAWQGRV